MELEFKENVNLLYPELEKDIKVSLTSSLPLIKDIYFKAKRFEIYRKYCSARTFLGQTQITHWWYWIPEEQQSNEDAKLFVTSGFYESALMFYNSIVDLSWIICYVSAKNIYNNQSTDFSIEEAYKLLETFEKEVRSPKTKTKNQNINSFKYIRDNCPDFEEPINLIIEFWNDFSNSTIRNNYNHIKHRGRPFYTEMQNIIPKYFNLYNENGEQLPSHISDLQHKISLNDSVNDLLDFDNNKLFPYIKNLLELIEKIIKPSP